ncbi:C-factor [Madurella mycetomatis]|uniref:C-factor n=1 Tax=Madurella mycetomatis TaxID=100816 RepID=A0A175W5S4_9PEZI|nr:C-factor [Madurella mycetomatis]
MPVYVVSGARTGIGLEYIRQLSRENENIVYILECDISSEDSIAGLPDRIRSSAKSDYKIDILINNAAILHFHQATSLTMSSDALASHITSNVVGPAKMLQALLPSLASNARVANISSGIGSLTMVSDGRINAEITPYSISKAALNMLTVHQARQLAGSEATRGIIVVAVDPGHAKTEMGGPDAVVEVADSARGVLRTLAGLTVADSGKFLLYTGDELPW